MRRSARRADGRALDARVRSGEWAVAEERTTSGKQAGRGRAGAHGCEQAGERVQTTGVTDELWRFGGRQRFDAS